MSDYDETDDLNRLPPSRSRSRSRSRGRSRGRSPSPPTSKSASPSGSVSSQEETDTESEVVDSGPPSVINFCSRHKMKLVPEECPACKAVVEADEAAKLLVPPLEDFPSADKRYGAARSDEKPSTLNLSDSTITVMDRVFTVGKFRSPKHFEAC